MLAIAVRVIPSCEYAFVTQSGRVLLILYWCSGGFSGLGNGANDSEQEHRFGLAMCIFIIINNRQSPSLY